MGSAVTAKPHAVCMPSPGQGHINSMLKLAKLLHSKGFYITFVHSDYNYSRILKTNSSSSLDGLPDFRFATIPDGLPPSDDTQVGQDVTYLSESMKKNFSLPFLQLLRRLNDASTSGAPSVTCIVSDAFTSFTLDAAKELRIPDVFFCSVSACGYMGVLQYKELMERGLAPPKSEEDLTNDSLDTIIDWIPGMKNIRLRDLPNFPQTVDPNHILFNLCNDEAQRAFEASSIIINTFDDLERPVLDALSSLLPPIYTVGPLSLFSRHHVLEDPLASLGSSLWREDHTCIDWLHGRKPGSVVYVNFGSFTTMTREHLLEFAWGLAGSGHDFLWVIRPDLVKGEHAVLPWEFEVEIEGRGLLASWCPQEQVLANPSIGGFLTHCGWNSTMESISHGVPMLCWPFFADQPTNCRYMCCEWCIGIEIDKDVKKEKVEGLIKELMGGEKGKEMKKKVVEWEEIAIRATSPGGTSFVNLDRVIQEVLLQGKTI